MIDFKGVPVKYSFKHRIMIENYPITFAVFISIQGKSFYIIQLRPISVFCPVPIMFVSLPYNLWSIARQ